MNCEMASSWMHDYLDGDISHGSAESLKQHLALCKHCSDKFDQLSTIESLCSTLPVPRMSEDLTDRIMSSMPKARRSSALGGWIRRHPAISAAALFLVFMLSSFVAMWNQDQQLTVSGPNLDVLEYEGSTVIVPAGKVVTGNLTVSNGSVRVLGSVEGDLTVIDGNVTLASTAHIAGHVQTVDRAIDWAWYKLRSWFGMLAYGS